MEQMQRPERALSLLAAVSVVVTAATAWAAGPLTPDDFIVVSGPASPAAAYAMRRTGGQLVLTLDVATFAADGSGTAVEVGLAAAGKVILTDRDAEVARRDRAARYTFTIPAAKLVSAAADWRRLRMGLAVRWTGGPLGADRLRERYRHIDTAAPHAGLSTRPEDWMGLDADEYDSIVADRKDRLAVSFTQPMDGRATIVIEDAQGRRVRNLIAGVKMAQGPRQVEWDGLDERGLLVAPGAYRWRSAHHAGIRPEYLFSFCNGGERFLQPFGSNHGVFTDATANGKYVFLAASITEGGYALIALDRAGRWAQGYHTIHGTGIYHAAIAADGKYLYVAHDGPAWGQRVDRKGDWKAPVRVTLTRFDIESGRSVDFPGGRRFAEIEPYDWGKGSANAHVRDLLSLAGLAVLDGRLYFASRGAQGLLVVDPATGVKTGTIALASPGALAAAGGRLYAVSGQAVVRIDPAAAGSPRTVVAAGQASPRGLAVDEAGNVYVSDRQSHTVKVFDPAGRALRTIGKPGGPYAGPYDPRRMVHPAGLVVAGGRLWVTEDRRNPKRALAWDLASGEVVVQKYGCPPYGGPGASFDPRDATRWLGLGATWKLDFPARTAACQSVLQKDWAHYTHYRFVRRDGRTFLICFGGATFIAELMGDGSMRDLAFVASTHRYSFACDWQPPGAFVEAFDKAYAGRKSGNRPIIHSDKGPGVLWVDRNGDGQYQAEEFDFSTEVDDFAGGYWGHDFADLTLRMPATVRGRRVLVKLEPDGYHPGGAPRYPSLNAACAAGVAVDLPTSQVVTAVDRFGNIICNGEPAMKCFSPDGRELWSFPNRWEGVHGSHAAPLPEVGVMQGALFSLGMAPLDDRADVFMLNGNHGRFFVLTSDGLYLDEMFKDVRLGGSRDELYIGGEAFGGSFGRSETDGEYYLQTGGDGYRVYRVAGLKELRRSAGEITVTPRQVMAAERKIARRHAAAAAARPKEATVAPRKGPIRIDGRLDDWPGGPSLTWDRSGRFGVEVRLAWDANDLYVAWQVADETPWVNNGKDWTTLFKTGDSVDLQLGTDPAGPPARRQPASGDLRLLIAPFEGKPQAVLYRHRLAGATDGVTFTSPWRSERVDSVRKLPDARLAIQTWQGGYRIEAAVPLAALGLKSPAGLTCPADFGVIYGDDAGTVNLLRSYWSNAATGLVNDVPGEIMLQPNLWGRVRFEK